MNQFGFYVFLLQSKIDFEEPTERESITKGSNEKSKSDLFAKITTTDTEAKQKDRK